VSGVVPSAAERDQQAPSGLRAIEEPAGVNVNVTLCAPSS
jgi:hypothetical protein